MISVLSVTGPAVQGTLVLDHTSFSQAVFPTRSKRSQEKQKLRTRWFSVRRLAILHFRVYRFAWNSFRLLLTAD